MRKRNLTNGKREEEGREGKGGEGKGGEAGGEWWVR